MNSTKWLMGLLMFTTGCAAPMNYTQADAVQGGIIGAFMGAVTGALITRNPLGLLVGAGAGGAAGAGIGAMAGNSVDQRQQAQAQALNNANDQAYQAAIHPPFSVADIGRVARDGWTETMITRQIVSTGSTYLLNPEQINWLRGQGVSNYVIEFMQSRAPRYVQGRFVPAPALVAPPVAVGIVGVVR